MGNKFDSVAATDDFTDDVVAALFKLITDLKGSNAMTGYVRYGLTNRWTNRFHFTKPQLDKLQAAVEGDDESKQNDVLDLLISNHKINEQAKANFLSYDKEKKLRNIEAWRKQPAITNMYYNRQNAMQFLNADKNKQLSILKQWSTVTLPTTDPSYTTVKFCIDTDYVQNTINYAYKINKKLDDDSIDRALNSGALDRQARADGITDADKSMFREIIKTLRDTHSDIRDLTSDEIDRENDRWKEMFGDEDINKEEDWSNVNWGDEDEEIHDVYKALNYNFNSTNTMDEIYGVRAIDSFLSQLAFNKSKWSSNKHGKVIHICNDPNGEDEIDGDFYIAPKKSRIDNRGEYRVYALKTIMLPTGPSKIIDKNKDFDINAHDVDHIDISYGDITIMLKAPVSTNY